jgi:hypothetical protein
MNIQKMSFTGNEASNKYIEEQRQKAIEYLGSKWILHKDNTIAKKGSVK